MPPDKRNVLPGETEVREVRAGLLIERFQVGQGAFLVLWLLWGIQSRDRDDAVLCRARAAVRHGAGPVDPG